MPNFAYTARDVDGAAVEGEIEADSEHLVAEQLLRNGITPVGITVAKTVPSESRPSGPRFWGQRVSLDELAMLARQLRTLMRAGVPILRGLKSLAETTDSALLSATLRDVYYQLEGGREMYAALAQHPKVFSPIFVALVQVGENTGKLDEAFGQLAEYLEMEKRTRERIASAIRYPLVVMFAVVVALVIMNIWVIPTFADAFARFDTELPLMTRFLMGTSAFFVTYWPAVLAMSVGGVFAFRQWTRSEHGEVAWSSFMLRAPLIGNIVRKAVLGRFAQSMSLTIQAGVPLIQALNVVAGVVDNAFVKEKVHAMRDGIEKGDSVSRTAAATGLFTPLVLQMLAVGEESGALDQLLEETAAHYDTEVEYELKRLSDAIEPVMITVIGVLVAVLALGIFLPLWDLSAAAGG